MPVIVRGFLIRCLSGLQHSESACRDNVSSISARALELLAAGSRAAAAVCSASIFPKQCFRRRGQDGARDGRVGGGATPIPTVPKRWVSLALNPSYEETNTE